MTTYGYGRASAYAARCARPSATSAARSNAHASIAGWLRTKDIAARPYSVA